MKRLRDFDTLTLLSDDTLMLVTVGFCILFFNVLYLWMEVWDLKRKAREAEMAVESRLNALESRPASRIDEYMSGTWLS